MPIIFGWGRQTTKQIGITFKHPCAHCHNEEHWILTRIMTWFTLFFIPIFPYSIKYILSCPICQYGITLDAEQLKEIRPLAEINQLLVEDKITSEEYQTKINQLNCNILPPAQTEDTETKALDVGESKLIYCASCGKTVAEDDKFCSSCGRESENTPG